MTSTPLDLDRALQLQNAIEVTTEDGIRVGLAWRTWYRRYDATSSVVEHGLCAELLPIVGDPSISVMVEPTVGRQWPYGWYTAIDDGGMIMQPTRIEGITDDEAPSAIQMLIDSGRAHRANRRARSKQARLAKTRLAEAAEALTTAGTLPPGSFERINAHETAYRRLDNAIRDALKAGMDSDEIRDAVPAIKEYRIRQVADSSVDERRPVYLDEDDVAVSTGLKPGTVRSYRSQGKLPEPDIMLGGSPGWLPSTIERWKAARLGQGYRSDLHDPQ